MPLHERRQIENEMIFRRVNEQVGINLNEIDALHVEDGNPHLVRENDIQLEFRCECSDENCDERIAIALSKYQKIHLNRSTFIIKINHQVEAIEEVIMKETTYSVVRKNNSTSEPNDTLNKTNVNNA